MKLAARSAALGLGASTLGAQAQHAPKAAKGPVLLTVSGLIGAGNRAAFDPQLDQLMNKHQVRFSKAHAFDFAAITALPAVTIEPTLEYDAKKHALKGPLFSDVMKAAGVRWATNLSFLVRAIDGYGVAISATEITNRRFVIATHLDNQPLALGGIGPLWSVYEADRFPDMASKSLKERFALCPWGTYHIDVTAG
ncbi:molybdopterin-dependent oxidoreductase [Diaphorobacter sp. HDW4A]|uniref:molybdopterin-dependent oxidoreductase n=1 Tax=Diaphorobacter sp. HDW4A TaxID=2714924 RepID=UPI00140D26A5|nr:molybdopterin-dependent oxidoreductase [Diaphorobacter sp. HDW4A]QIL80050.1 molybdopterin-dependent oxidoreductase [Diaphorobacter sp. HDW4A]